MTGSSDADDRRPSAAGLPRAGRKPGDPPRPRVRRYLGDGDDRRAARPESERDEVWGDPAPDDASERLRRDVPPHHGG